MFSYEDLDPSFQNSRRLIVAPWVWFVVAGFLLIVEMLTVDLLFASLAFAALAAGITDALGGSQTLQGIVFGACAVGSVFALRPIAMRHLKKQPPNSATNVDALIGARALTLTQVDPNGGQVKLNGETWSATTEFENIESGESVVIEAIHGATARVKK